MIYNAQDHYWLVGDDFSRFYSGRRRTFVPGTDPELVAWMEMRRWPTRIRNQVELNDVLLRQAPQSALDRTFTAAEIIEALAIIDLPAIEAFRKAGLDAEGPLLAGRTAELAEALGVRPGAIAGPP